jgi:Tfp pilus assembly protein PilN
MIQFNLLPDVKKEYIKAKKTKRVIISVSIASTLVSVVIVAVLFSFVQIGQKKYIDDLTKDISRQASEISSIEDINRMLTVQSQLRSLPILHEQKPETSRIFNYLSQVIPTSASLSSVTVDVPTATLSIAGDADSVATVNKLVDIMRFASYSTDEAKLERLKIFTVTTTSLSGTNDGATFQLTATFDPLIFNNTKEVTFHIEDPVAPQQAVTDEEVSNE